MATNFRVFQTVFSKQMEHRDIMARLSDPILITGGSIWTFFSSPPPPPSLAPLSLLEKDKTQFHFALLLFSEQLNSTQTTTGNNHLQKITGSNLWMRNLYHEKFAYFRKRKNKLSTCDLITGQYWWGMVNLGLQNSFS